VFLSYAIVTKDEVILYTMLSKITEEVKSILKGQVMFKPYEQIFTDLSQFGPLKDLTNSKEVSFNIYFRNS
jgi:hypothetical protein